MVISDIFCMEMPVNIQLFICLLFIGTAFMRGKSFICLSFACKRLNSSIIGDYHEKSVKIGRFLFACCLLDQLVAEKRGV